MNRRRFLIALLLADLGLFVFTVVFLPKTGYWYSDPVLNFFKSRSSWEVAWGVLLSSLLLSGGLYFAVTSFYPNDKHDVA